MGHGGGGLQQQQAVLGGRGEDAAAAGFAGDGLEVELGVEAEQGELEAVLPALLAVAGAGVAAEAGEQGLDVALEGGHASGRGGGFRFSGNGRRGQDGQQQEKLSGESQSPHKPIASSLMGACCCSWSAQHLNKPRGIFQQSWNKKLLVAVQRPGGA